VNDVARPERRRLQQRRRRRRRLVAAVALIVLVAAGVGAWLALRDSSDDATVTAGSRESSPSTTAAPPTTTVPPTTTTSAPAGPPFAVGVTRLTVEDTTRGTVARGPTPESSTRVLPLTVHYPATGAPGSAVVENAPAATGTFPLVVFAHGYAITAGAYDPLTADLAAGGFIVVAPDFPISSLVFPGPASQLDMANQAHDISFIIDVFQNGTAVPGVLQGHLAPGKVAVTGHSDGGATVSAVSGNSCCLDPRIGASASLAGDQGGVFPGEWFQANASPQLFMHGTADPEVPFAYSQKLYDDTVAPKMFVSVTDAVHLEPFVTGPQRPTIVALILDFFRANIQNDAEARARIPADANVEGVLKLEAQG
jgi:predicted dienelactone hydrolase